jgi:hypothetical protein
MNTELQNLYVELRALEKYRTQIYSIEEKIRTLKHNCKHVDAVILEEGTEFDGYDRNEYYALIYCGNCDQRFKVYEPNKTAKYKLVQGLTKLNQRK